MRLDPAGMIQYYVQPCSQRSPRIQPAYELLGRICHLPLQGGD